MQKEFSLDGRMKTSYFLPKYTFMFRLSLDKHYFADPDITGFG